MVEAFHNNIKTLLSWHNCAIGWSPGRLVKLVLLLLVVGFGIGACLLPTYSPPDYTLLSAIPIAIFSFILILEPLKCLAVTWILFLQRLRPAFHYNPVFMKSNPLLLRRARLSLPKLSDEFRVIAEDSEQYNVEPTEDNEAYYNKFCMNRAREQLFDRRRRILPILTENDIPLDLEAVKSSVCVEEAPSNLHLLPPIISQDTVILPLHRDSVEQEPDNERKQSSVNGRRSPSTTSSRSTTISPNTPGSITTKSDKEPLVLKENHDHTAMIYCRYSNMP